MFWLWTNPTCTRTKEGLKVLFSLQAELGCRVLSEFQCQGRKCHNSQSCIRSRCGVHVQPHCLEGGHESRGNESNRTYHRTLSLSAFVHPLLGRAMLDVCWMSVLFCLEPSKEELEPSEALFPRSQGLLPWPEPRASASPAGGCGRLHCRRCRGRRF